MFQTHLHCLKKNTRHCLWRIFRTRPSLRICGIQFIMRSVGFDDLYRNLNLYTLADVLWQCFGCWYTSACRSTLPPPPHALLKSSQKFETHKHAHINCILRTRISGIPNSASDFVCFRTTQNSRAVKLYAPFTCAPCVNTHVFYFCLCVYVTEKTDIALSALGFCGFVCRIVSNSRRNICRIM